MSGGDLARQGHRWIAIAFWGTVLAYLVALALGAPEWVAYVPLLPLALLAFTGLYLLVSERRRRGHGQRTFGPPNRSASRGFLGRN